MSSFSQSPPQAFIKRKVVNAPSKPLGIASPCITVWGNGLTDMLQKNGPKGRRIMVTGELRQDNYTSDKGEKFLTLSVTLTPSSVVSFIDAKQFQKQDQPIPQPA